MRTRDIISKCRGREDEKLRQLLADIAKIESSARITRDMKRQLDPSWVCEELRKCRLKVPS